MRGAERIIFAFGALGETRKATGLSQCANTVATPGQNLVRIGLMPHVPDDPVCRSVEDIVQRHGQFDHAKSGAEMASGLRDGIDQLGAQFRCHLRQITRRQRPKLGWNPDLVQKRSVGS